MSAVGRLVAFFLEPAIPRESSPSPARSSSSREGAAAGMAEESPSSREGASGGGTQGDASRRSERPFGEATDHRILGSNGPPVGSLDGTAVRRLAVATEAVARPSLRLVPPLDKLAAEGGEEMGTGGVDPSADERAPRGETPSPVPEEAGAWSPGPGSVLDERSDEHRRSGAPGAPAPRVCILGDGRSSAAFARALAGRLAGAPGARCAILACVAELPGSGASPAATARPAARRLARALRDGGLAATARGRLVELTLPGAGCELAEAAGLREPPPIVLALPATRTTELDALLTGCDLALLVVRADTPPALTALAVAGLERTIPGTSIHAITLPVRAGGAARRAALHRAMEALR